MRFLNLTRRIGKPDGVQDIELIRKDRDLLRLRELLLAGAASPAAAPADATYFKGLRSKCRLSRDPNR